MMVGGVSSGRGGIGMLEERGWAQCCAEPGQSPA